MRLSGVPLRPGTARGRALLGKDRSPRPEDRSTQKPAGTELSSRIVCADSPDDRLVRWGSEEVVGWVLSRRSLGPSDDRPALPCVGGLEPDIFRDGDLLALDGGAGSVDLEKVEPVPVVTSFLQRGDGTILLLRRSEKVGSFQGSWAGVSGFLEDPTPEGQAVREIREETGITEGQLALASQGRPVYARDAQRVFVVHPFRFLVQNPPIRLDWEHVAYEWVAPDALLHRPTVPKLDRVWASVAPPSGSGASEGKA